MRDTVGLIIKAETEGLDSLDEVVQLAVAYIVTGLVDSTGSNQRFVASVWDQFPDEMEQALRGEGTN